MKNVQNTKTSEQIKLASTAASSDEDESEGPIEYFIECSGEKNAVDLA
jgi:hypothetical protein